MTDKYGEITEGEWVRDGFDLCRIIVVRDGPDDHGNHYLDGRHSVEIAYVRRREDAPLIAAAPELYEAIKLILPLAKGYRPKDQTPEARHTCREWIAAAESALAKAIEEQESDHE